MIAIMSAMVMLCKAALLAMVGFGVLKLLRPSVPRVTALVLNLAMVAYLIDRLRGSRETGTRRAGVTRTQQ